MSSKSRRSATRVSQHVQCDLDKISLLRSVQLESLYIFASVSTSTCRQPYLAVVRADRHGNCCFVHNDCTEGFERCDNQRLRDAFFSILASSLCVLPLGCSERSVIHQTVHLPMQRFRTPSTHRLTVANNWSEDTHRIQCVGGSVEAHAASLSAKKPSSCQRQPCLRDVIAGLCLSQEFVRFTKVSDRCIRHGAL